MRVPLCAVLTDELRLLSNQKRVVVLVAGVCWKTVPQTA
jgi:hypothetical protein